MDRASARPAVDTFPGPKAEAWIGHHTDVAAPSEHSHDFVWDVTADAEGPFVTDIDGNVLLDFTCHIGAAPLGYNNPKVLSRMEAFDLVDPLKIAGQDMYFAGGGTVENPELPGATQLMDRLVEISDRYDMDTVFLSNSGAEAIENAMKIAYDNTPDPKYGFTTEKAFHGRTLGTLSVTRASGTFTRKYPEISGIREIPFCVDRDCGGTDCSCGFFGEGGSVLRRHLDETMGHLPADEVAFLIIEPIQGVGGYRFPSEEYLAEIQAVTDEYDVHLVVDEIQSGMGRTGEWWAADHYPFEPDIITSAKGLRVGATISRSDVFPTEKDRLGSTWGGGDVIASLQGAVTIDAIAEHSLLDHATEQGRAIRERLRDAETPGLVDIRGKGLMLGIEFDTAARRDAVIEETLSRGMLTLGAGRKTIRLLPPLDVTDREVELGVDILVDSIDAADGP